MFEILEWKPVSDKIQMNNMRQFIGSISKNLKHFNPVKIFSFGGGVGRIGGRGLINKISQRVKL